MLILGRCYDLLAWLLPKTEGFPRPYRHTLTRRMADAAWDVQEALFAAQGQRGRVRRERLAQADIALDRLRAYLRLAHEWHWLNDGQYAHISAIVAEIGRLLGGWIRHTESALVPRVSG
jgi:hypothetical protein